METERQLLEVLEEEKMIVSIKSPKAFDEFLDSPITTGFLLMGNINNLQPYVQELKHRGKIVFLHLERVQGIRVDQEGLSYIATQIKPHGIITTKKQLIASAKKMDLLTIQRLFLVDSDATRNGLEISDQYNPDLIEVMPGIIPTMIEKITEDISKTLITGGLVEHESQIQAALDHGAAAVSTSNIKLCKKFLKREDEAREKGGAGEYIKTLR